jgi:hypothetical protein
MTIYNITIEPWLAGQAVVAAVLIAAYWLWYRYRP